MDRNKIFLEQLEDYKYKINSLFNRITKIPPKI